MSTTSSYTVTGMTCGHCAASVREEIEEIAGVTSVDVSVETGAVRVVSEHEIPREEIEKAVTEAGYALA
ncbi:heavy-metal-associated domain-containing protein [Gordonia paraffinivorans]|uniref:Mercuric reductase n=1 Tax=Gordonia paraffinivorans TaxID=175628 RepID=A0ABD7V485_9ACTN|nr:heavy metal-associated domain-containing protein [Gordonia paraffinivorans]MCD2146994.1 heavy-metal-associated domain-containing protein [Gordonia paraffinivorans]VFA89183.1 Mercuric reductase [Gordonia paraffinivorans]